MFIYLRHKPDVAKSLSTTDITLYKEKICPRVSLNFHQTGNKNQIALADFIETYIFCMKYRF